MVHCELDICDNPVTNELNAENQTGVARDQEGIPLESIQLRFPIGPGSRRYDDLGLRKRVAALLSIQRRAHMTSFDSPICVIVRSPRIAALGTIERRCAKLAYGIAMAHGGK